MAGKTNRLNIYLVKPELTAFDQIIKPEAAPIEIPGVGTFYMEDSHARTPDWVTDFFGNRLDDKLRLLTASAKGVLLVRVPEGDREQIFAIAFGHGRYLLQNDVVEERFGLKVVLNSLERDSFRSIDKTTLGSVAKQSREQISREGAATSFGLDIEQDLVSSVTGRSAVKQFGRTVTGRDSFSASAAFNAGNVSEMLKFCLERYRSDAYKEDYDWIDQIRELRTRSKIDALNEALIARVQAGEFDRIWLAPPDIVEWADVKGFRYARPKRGELHDDLAMTDLVAVAGEEPVTLKWLKNTNIHLISAKTDNVQRSWPALKCLYAELDLHEAVHVLDNGKWYEISTDFTARIKQDFDSLAETVIEVPDYTHADEEAYNKALAEALAGSCCLDRTMIPHGGGKSSIEFCDVMTGDKKLLHVKRYSGSAQLSHLFFQGVVSGELFVSDAAFRAKLNEKLPDGHKLANVGQRPDPRDYEVVFAIISKSANPLEIPFFSKVSLRNARRRLEGYGYRVSKKKIVVSANA